MPDCCSVYGCANRSSRDKDKRFYRIPKEVTHKGERTKNISKNRREKWLSNLSLSSKGIESPHARVCSDHFVKGCPSNLYDEEDVDWAPTLKLGHQKLKPLSKCDLERKDRTAKRDLKRRSSDAAGALLELQKQRPRLLEISNDTNENDLPIADPQFPTVSSQSQTADCSKVDAQCQTDLTIELLKSMEQDCNRLNEELYNLRAKTLDGKFNKECFENNDEKTKFYTGLPNFLVFLQVFHLCETWISHTERSALGKFEQLILVLMRLRLNLPLQDLAYRFGISCSTASRIFNKVITTLHFRLQFLIEWPERETLWATMPMDFRKSFGSKVAVVIDCFEVFIERPSNLLARAQTWSNYKHHNTVKFLIGISPQGLVTFISDAWGGRVSDKHLTEESGILQNLLPGDVVLADRGFNIEDSVGLYCASLKIPAFTKGKSQLSAYEVEETRKIANVRIHVERVIGLVRRKYQVLQSRALPIEFMYKRPGETHAIIDKIAVICCALTNLSESVVPLE